MSTRIQTATGQLHQHRQVPKCYHEGREQLRRQTELQHELYKHVNTSNNGEKCTSTTSCDAKCTPTVGCRYFLPSSIIYIVFRRIELLLTRKPDRFANTDCVGTIPKTWLSHHSLYALVHLYTRSTKQKKPGHYAASMFKFDKKRNAISQRLFIVQIATNYNPGTRLNSSIRPDDGQFNIRKSFERSLCSITVKQVGKNHIQFIKFKVINVHQRAVRIKKNIHEHETSRITIQKSRL